MSGAISGYERRAFYAAPGFRFRLRALRFGGLYPPKLAERAKAGRFIRATNSLYGSLPANKERKRNAGRRGSPRPVRKRRTGRATEKAAYAALPLRARSPAGVPPRHLRQRPNATAQLQFTRFLGRYEVGM